MNVAWELLVLLLCQGIGANGLNEAQSGSSWAAVSSTGPYSTAGFGGSTKPSGSGVTYVGNIGHPYGSNIIDVSQTDVSMYQYVAKFVSPNTDGWKVVIWNKGGPQRLLDGWFGNACHELILSSGEEKYVAFAPDSQGGWAAANTASIPTDQYGAYASTWGEFDFGSVGNHGWSGFDVSVIVAQNASLEIQGMQICSVLNDPICSSVTWNADNVDNAYTSAYVEADGIGGNLYPGPVRLAVDIGYSG